MKSKVGDFELEPLEQRLLLSAVPLFPQALAAVPSSPEVEAVRVDDFDQQATHSDHSVSSYDPANHVSGLFADAQPVSAAVSPLPAAMRLDATPVSSATTPGEGYSATSVVGDASAAQPARSFSGTASSGTPRASAGAPSASVTTDIIVETLNAAQPPPSSGVLSYTAGPHGSNLTLKVDAHNPAQLDLIDNTAGRIVAAGPLGQVDRVVVIGANNANDTLTVDMSTPFWLSGGISFSGGTGPYDTLAITTPAGVSVDYTALGGGDGTARATDGVHDTLVSFTDLEPVNITASSFAFSPGTANADVAVDLTIGTAIYTDPTTGASEVVNQITGSFGGAAFESVNLVGVSNLTIDLSGAFDGAATPYTGNDTITIASGFVSPNLQYVTILTGAGTNTVTIAASSIELPASGGSLTVDGGAGTTSLVVSGSYTTAAVDATSPTAGSLSLDGSSLDFSNISLLQIPSTVTITPNLQDAIEALLGSSKTSEQLPVVSLGGMLELNNVQLTVTASDSVSITAARGTLFPGRSFSALITSSSEAPAVTGSYTVGGVFNVSLPSTATMTLTVGEAFVIEASNFSLSYDPNGSTTQSLATVAGATVLSPHLFGVANVPLSDFSLRSDGFSVADFTLDSSAVSLNGVFTSGEAALAISGFTVSYGYDTTPASLSGTVELTLADVELYPSGGWVQFSATSVTPSYDFASFDGRSATGRLKIDIAGLTLDAGGVLQVTTGDTAVVLMPGQPVTEEIAGATLTSPGFTGSGSLQFTDLVLDQDGFAFAGAAWAWSSSDKVSIDSIVEADGVTLTLSSLGSRYGVGATSAGSISVLASGVVLFPTVPLLNLSLGTLSGSYVLGDTADPAGYLTLHIPSLDIPLGDALTIHLGAVDLTPGLSPVVHAADATVTANLFSGLPTVDLGAFDLTSTGFTLGSFTISESSTVTIGSFFSLSSLTIDVNEFAVDISRTQPVSGSIAVTLGTLTLFPGTTVFTSTFTNLQGNYNFTGAAAQGRLSFTADSMTLSIADQLRIVADNITLTPGLTTVATIDNATLTFAPLDSLAVVVNGLVIRQTGVSITLATAALADTLTLGSILSLQTPTVTLTDVDYTFGGGLTGTVGFSSAGASLQLASALTTSTGDLTGSYDLATGALSAALENFSVEVPHFASFSAGSVSIAYTPASDGTAEILVGATGLNAFLGPGIGTSRVGVEITGGTLALAVFEGAGGANTYSLDAQGAAALVGMPAGSLCITAGNLEFRSNTAGAVSTVVTVGGTAVYLNFTGNGQSALARNLSMSVGTFASLEGDFGFSQVTSGSSTSVVIGATNVTATVAAGNVSLTVTGGSLGLLIQPGGSTTSTTYALVAGGGTDSLNGVPGLTLTATGLTVRVRKGLDATAVTGLPAQVETPGGSVSPDFSGLGSGTSDITDVQGVAALTITSFVSITGSFGFQQFTDGSSTYLAVGASDLTIVLGTAAANLTIRDATLSLVIESGSGADPAKYALEAHGGSAQLTGVPGFNIAASGLLVRVRRGLDLSGDTAVPPSVETPNGSVALDFSGLGPGTTDVTDIEGKLTLEVAGFGSLEGDFGFQTFTDGSTGMTEWAVGATGTTIILGTATTNLTVSGASLALLVRPGQGTNATTYALEAKASSASLNGAGDLSVNASSLLVRIRRGLDLSTASGLPASVQTSGGEAVFDFSGLPAGSSNLVDVEGSVTLYVGSFVALSGNFGIQSYTDVTGDYLELGGTDITVTFTAGSVNLTLANATLGVVVKQGTTASYAVQAKGSSNPTDTKLNGVDDLTLAASNLLFRARYGLDASTLPAGLPTTIHTSGGDVMLDFASLGSGTGAVTDIEGHVTLKIAGFASLEGDFGIQRFADESSSYLAVGARNVTAVLGTPGVNVTVAGASLALLVKPGGAYDLFADGGTDTLNGVPGLSLSASGLTIQSHHGVDLSTVGGMPTSVQVPGGSVNFSFSGLGSADVTAIAGHITLNIADLVSLTGDFSFTRETSGSLTKILVGATGVDAFVGSADQSFGVQITGASMALVIYRDITTVGSTYALETSAPDVTVKGLPSGIMLTGAISVAVNTTGRAVSETFGSNPYSISFTDGTNGSPDQTNIRSFGGSLTLGVGSIFTVTGDFSFTQSTSGAETVLLIGAAKVGTALNTSVSADGGAGSFTLSNGTLGLLVFQNGTYALKASGTATATAGGSALSASATLTVRINTTPSPQNETVTVGTATISVVFSSTEVATGSGGTATLFKQITVGNASLSIDDTLIVTAGEASPTTPVTGAESTALTSVTLTLQNPGNSAVLFTISADSAIFTAFSGTVTASAASSAGLSIRADGGSWTAGDKDLVLTNVTFSIGSLVTFTSDKIDVQHYTSGSTSTDSFRFTGAIVRFYAGGKPMVSLKGSPSFHYSTTDGFKLDSFSDPGVSFLGAADPPATVPLGPVTLNSPSVSLGSFDFGFGTGTTADLSATITISAATATIGSSSSPVHAAVTNVTGSFDVMVEFDIANLSAAPTVHANGFTISAQTFTIALGSYLTLSAGGAGETGIRFDPTAGSTQDLVSFSSLTAILHIGGGISGTASNFAIEGNGSFLAKPGFGVSITLGEGANGDAATTLSWPSWFPLQSASITLVWSNFNSSPTDFVVELSASVGLTEIKGIPLNVSGSVTDMVIDPSLVGSGRFPVVSIGSAGITVKGNLFGGTVEGALIVGVVRFDADGALVDGLGNLVGTTTPGTGSITNVFYAGIEASFQIGKMIGFSIRVGLSEYGPLQVYVAAGVAIPLGNTGLFLTDFRGGVEFNAQFPAITTSTPPEAGDALQLRQPAFSTPDSLTVAQWEAQLRKQVVAQYQTGVDGWSNLGSASMIIQAGATIYEGSPDVFRVNADVFFDTSGKFLVVGTATFGNNLSIGVKMYTDLSSLFKASDQTSVSLTILFLMEVPTSGTPNPVTPPIYSLYGVAQFTYADNVFQLTIAGAADLNILNGLEAHAEATLTLTFSANSFTVALSDASFSIPQIQSDPVGTAAGTLTIQTMNGTTDIWGGFLLVPNLHGLSSLGIDVGGQVFIKLNTTGEVKQVILSNGTLTLLPESFDLFVNGAANFKIGGAQLFQLKGTLDFQIANGSFTLFVQAQLLMGADPENPILSFNANGLIFVQVAGTAQLPAGFAAKMMLSMTKSVPGITFNENWLLVMNTTGVEITYYIPAPVGNAAPVATVMGPDYGSGNPLALISYETTVDGRRALVIPDGPPGAGLTGYATWTPILPNTPYLIILGRGSLTVADSFNLTGNINIDAVFGPSGFVFNLDANATLALRLNGNTVFSFAAVGGVAISDAGVVAALVLSLSPGFNTPSSLGFSLSGTFLLELNTTGEAATVNNIAVPAGANGLFAEIHAVGDLKFLGGVVDLSGSFDITATGESITIAVDADITFLNATFSASGFAGIYYDSHPGVALRIQLGLPGGAQGIAPVPALGDKFVISGTFTLAINTSSVNRDDQNGDPIVPGSRVSVADLGVYLFGFNLTGSLSISVTNAGFGIDISYLRLNLFGLANLTLNGYYHPDHTFRFTGSGAFQYGDHTFGIGGSISVTISNSGFAASVSGWAAAFHVQVGASGAIVITDGSVDISVSITVVVHLGTAHFHLGHTSPPPEVPQPPRLAGVNDGVLTLFLGSDVSLRVNAEGVETGPQAEENYTLILGSNANSVVVSALGYTQTFTGVNSILVRNTESGNDTILIGYDIALPVSITLGSGNNTITTGSGAATVVISGNGINRVTTGDGATITISGNGANSVSTGSGSTVVISGDGANTTATNGGSAPFTISGDGNNTVMVNHAGTFTFDVSGTGANSITIAGGSPTIHVASSASGANQILINTSGVSIVLIGGNGSNRVTVVGTGAPLITVTGGGANQIMTGAGRATITLQGAGTNHLTTGAGAATVYDQGTGSTIIQGGSGGGVLIGGVTAAGFAFTTKGASSLATLYGNFSAQISGYPDYTLGDAGLSYGAFALTLSGVKDMTLTAALGPDVHTFTLEGWTGDARLNGSGSDNTVVVVPAAGVANLAYVLTDAQLQVTGSVNQRIALFGIQTAELVGGAGVNSFDVSGWSGDGHLIGPQGSLDSVVASGDAAVYSLADTSLARTGHGPITLAGIQQAILSGGAGANVFNVANWGGRAHLDGSGGNDIYNLTLPGTTAAVFTVADTGASSGDMLNIAGSRDFFVTANQIRDGTERVIYSGIELLDLFGAADGLSYYVQSTAAGVITSIETGGPASFVDVASTAGQVPAAPGAVSAIQGTLSLAGGGTMMVDDTGSSAPQSGTLTPTSLTGLRMGSGGIQYRGLSLLTINLGPWGNTLAVHDIDPATHTVVDGGSSAFDTVNLTFAGDFAGRIDLTGFEHGTLTVTANFDGTLNDGSPGQLESVLIGASLTAAGLLNAGGIDAMSVGQDLAGRVTASGTLGALTVGGGVSGTVKESGVITTLAIGSLTSTGRIDVANAADPSQYAVDSRGDILTMTVSQDLAGHVAVSGNMGSLVVGGTLSGTVAVRGALDALKVSESLSGSVAESGPMTVVSILRGDLTASGTITAVNTIPATAGIATLSVGRNLAGVVLVSGTIGRLDVGGDLSGSVTESGTIDSLTIGGSLTETGSIAAVNVAPDLGNLGTLTIGQDFAGSVTVSGRLGMLAITNGWMEPTAKLTVGNLDNLAIGPDQLRVGANLAGVIKISGTLQSLRVAGGMPGTIIAGHIGTISVYGGFGPVALNVTENGIQRLVEATTPAQPYPLPDPYAVALAQGRTEYVNFQLFYESGSLTNPQLTVRVTNGVGTAPGRYDLSLITYNDAAKFNLARLDASGVAGVRSVVVEGDLLTAVSVQAAAFFMVSGPGGSMVRDATPAGIRLPADHLAGVSIRDFAPDGSIQAASIQGVAFGSFSERGRILTGAYANAHDAQELLACGTRIVQASDTFRVAFADLRSQQVSFFFAADEHGGRFDDHSIQFAVQSLVTANADGTANIVTASNVARGSATALVTITPTVDRRGKLQDSVVSTVAVNGDGASIRTGQWISQGITSGGSLGDLVLSSNRGITNVTATSIFGSINSPGPLTGTIQTTGLHIDPITGAVSSVSATIGRLFVVSCDHGHQVGCAHHCHRYTHNAPCVVATTISIGGGLSGSIISRGDLESTIVSRGAMSGVIAVQGNLGESFMSSGSMQRLGGIVLDGALRGTVVVLGQQTGDVTFDGGFKGGAYAVAGGILGNLTINGGLDRASMLVSGGQIGSTTLGTALRLNGENRGIIAALGSITYAKKAPRGWVFDDADANPYGPDATAIKAIFTDQSVMLSLDINLLDLGGLSLIMRDLDSLYVNCQGNLVGPVA